MARDRKRTPRIITLDEFLGDPLIRMVMKADRVEEAEVRSLFHTIQSRRRPTDNERSAAETAAIRYGLDAQYRPGVGMMLFDRQGRVFVGRRLGATRNAWQMPQGGIDEGEEPQQAALRELREEIGTDRVEFLAESTRWLHYDVPADVAHRTWGGHWRGQQQKWFAMRFTGNDTDINIATDHPEFSAWRWVPVSVVPRLIVSFKRKLYEDVVTEFRALHPVLDLRRQL